jgi:proline racemase
MAIEPIRTIEMHTGGEPVRIVVSGYPPVLGSTILEKRRYAKERLDHLRRMLIFEPRGHFDMYGVIPVEPDHHDADLAVLFMHNEGYSTMCGHATIALGRWAVDTGLVPAVVPVTRLAIQVPAGLLQVSVAVTPAGSGVTTFESVPAFVAAAAVPVAVPGHGTVPIDVAYGGAFYAVLPAALLGLNVRTSSTRELVDAAWAVTGAVRSSVPIDHPDAPDLAFLYGTILTDGSDEWSDEPTANVCVFAQREVDRSPTGSGVTARIALQYAREQIGLGVERRFESLTGSTFAGKAVRESAVGGQPAVIVAVSGHAHYTGEATFTIEEDDPLDPFLLR